MAATPRPALLRAAMSSVLPPLLIGQAPPAATSRRAKAAGLVPPGGTRWSPVTANLVARPAAGLSGGQAFTFLSSLLLSVILHALLLAWLPPRLPAPKAENRSLPRTLEVHFGPPKSALAAASALAPVTVREAAQAPAGERHTVRAPLPPAPVSPPSVLPVPAAGLSAETPANVPAPAAQPVPSAPVAQELPPAEPKVTPPDLRAAYETNPAPAYPLAARRLGLEGRVVLWVEIRADGRCGELAVRESSGHAVLDEAAAAAVRRWRFQPARRGGEPVTSWAEIPIRFRLTGWSADPDA